MAREKTKRTVSRKVRAERAAKHQAYRKAFRVAQKLGFKGPDHGKGAWKAIHRFCVSHGISYPGARKAAKPAKGIKKMKARR
jgi:hypothetical protein